jgi:glycosyltransferase involved in cell wall biosynthesis
MFELFQPPNYPATLERMFRFAKPKFRKPGNEMKPIVALLGRRDAQSDGVQDYCEFLGAGLEQLGIELTIARVEWNQSGWLGAMKELWRVSEAWRARWVMLHYTALGWSRRGFPFGAVAAILLLRTRGVKCGVVFHEPYRQGERNVSWMRRLRGACQELVIHNLHRVAVRSIFTIPLRMISWLPKRDTKSVFIPIGANVPEPATLPEYGSREGNRTTVSVFCLSDPPFRGKEIREISYAMRCAARTGPGLRIVFLGKGTREASGDIERAFDGIPVEVTNLGLCEREVVSRVLAGSQAMLCVRGKLNLRRGSALAGIACAVPILAYAGGAEGTALLDAGIEFVAEGDLPALGAALTRVLEDQVHWQILRDKNVFVQQKHFSWDVIAASYVQLLSGTRA